MNRSYPYLILGFVAWSLGVSPTPAVGDVRYTITELPMDSAQAINDSGVVLGTSRLGPTLWQNGQVWSAPGSATGTGYGMNSENVVVGGQQRAYKWEGSTVTLLPALGEQFSSARAINDSGQIVGWLGNSGTTSRGCLWEGENVTLLGALGGELSWPYAINEAGDIVGQAETGPPTPTGPGPRQAFLYHNGVMTPIVGARSVARDINDVGQVVGRADDGPFLWYGGYWEILPEPAGNDYGAEAIAINNEGVVVGYANNATGYQQAAVWQQGEGQFLIDLIPADSGWMTLERATDINDAGQIVGWGLRENYTLQAFLLTPIPEPSTVFLFALIAVLRIRRR